MKNVLFLDLVCNKAYSPDVLANEPLGGTEATVVRVAEALSQYAKVTVMQHNRLEQERFKANYMPVSYLTAPWDCIVELRTSKALPALRQSNPEAKIIYWAHDMPGKAFVEDIDNIIESRATIVGVSDFHCNQLQMTMLSHGKIAPIRRIYNPIDNDLIPNETKRDPKKLVFFSSPHKGLAQSVALFEYVRQRLPFLKLYVANPGYLPNASLPDNAGCVNLYALPHSDVMQHVREALCVFYPNYVFPETFGLVFAEANAVGTPVLTHDLGAAREILDHPGQLADCKQPGVLTAKLRAWAEGVTPVVRGKPEFRLSVVAKVWRNLLGLE